MQPASCGQRSRCPLVPGAALGMGLGYEADKVFVRLALTFYGRNRIKKWNHQVLLSGPWKKVRLWNDMRESVTSDRTGREGSTRGGALRGPEGQAGAGRVRGTAAQRSCSRTSEETSLTEAQWARRGRGKGRAWTCRPREAWSRAWTSSIGHGKTHSLRAGGGHDVENSLEWGPWLSVKHKSTLG